MKKLKKFRKWFGFMLSTVIMILIPGNTFAMADATAIQDPVGSLDGGPGSGVAGANTQTQSQSIVEDQFKDLDYYQKQINKRITEMQLESCPVDQILRSAARINHSSSIVVKYYQIGQRPITSTLSADIAATNDGVAHAIKPANNSVFSEMDTILFPSIMGYQDDGTRETLRPLMVQVVARDATNYPMVIALNGKKNTTQGNHWDLPDIPAGTLMLRLGRAAAESDVETDSYYQLPEASEQYCQRFIMQAEESIIERMSAKIVDWDFSKQERVAMDDMRNGIERSGLFGIKSKTRYGKMGNIYTTGGIYWVAGKDIQLGHWQPKTEKGADGSQVPVTLTTYTGSDGKSYSLEDLTQLTGKYYVTSSLANGAATDASILVTQGSKNIYEYAISEQELTEFINQVIKDAGNGSRTKLLFVDNLIYKALSNLKSSRRVILQTETNYKKWGLDFEQFSSMGTKILIYRHDAFNYMGMSGAAFLLDPRYLEKWVFGDWARKEYNLKDLFIRNSNAVVMEEFSCWTLYYPNAHARISRPTFDTNKGVTDEVAA
nr:hypothetical protein [uncultured Prevotella sp.]